MREGSTSASGSFSFRRFGPQLWEGIGVDGFSEVRKGVLKQKVSESRAECVRKSRGVYGEVVGSPVLLIGVAGEASKLNESKLIAVE